MTRMFPRDRTHFFFATSILSAAIGSALAVFTVVNALWLRPLPFPESDRLVVLPMAVTTSPQMLEHVAGAGSVVAGQVILDKRFGLRPQFSIPGVTRSIEVLAVTPGYFQVLGLPLRGRDFRSEDDREGAEPVAILSHHLWVANFASREDLIGTVIPATPLPVRVIGIAPAGFRGARRGENCDVWLPRTLVPALVPTQLSVKNIPLMLFARLGPGVAPRDIESRLHVQYSPTRSTPYFGVVPLRDVFGTPELPTIVIREGSAFSIVAGLAMLVLVGGCAALAAVVLVHYERRRPEFAVRTALGASRGDLVRQLSIEIVSITAGGVLGAVLLARLVVRMVPELTLPGGVDLRRLDLSIDWRVFGVAVSMTVATLFLATLWPLARFTRGRRSSELFGESLAAGSRTTQRVQQSLLGVLAAATLIVLVNAGLFVRAVVHGFSGAAGFDADHTVFVAVQVASPTGARASPSFEVIAERTARARDALSRMADVKAVAYGPPPIDPESTNRLRNPVHVDSNGRQHELRLGRLDGSPELLSALGVRILAGRELASGDGNVMPTPAIVTASLASRLWPTENPLGQVMSTNWRGGPLQVVGIAGDFVFGSLTRPAEGVVVTARSDSSMGVEPRFAVKTDRPSDVVRALEQAVREVLPEASWIHAATGQQVIASDLGRQRLGAWFFSGFGAMSFLLGIGSILGLVSYMAESRKREFGVRLALGATAADLLKRCAAAVLVPVSVGAVAGTALAAILARLVSAFLVGVSAVDPWTYGTILLAIMASTLFAALKAAWPLRRLVPTAVLRSE